MTNCSCIKGFFNIVVEPLGCEALRIVDLSDWMDEDYYTIPDSYPVNVSLPTSAGSVQVNIKPQGEKIIKATELTGSSGQLKDGIYCITIDNCGTIYSRNIAVTCSLECRIDSLLVSAESDEDFDKIFKLNTYLQSINANISLDRIETANAYYKILRRELDKLNCPNC